MVTFKVDNLKNMKAELKTFSDFLKASGVSDDAVFASKLVSCELITNVIRHSGGEAEFCGRIESGGISITVSSESFKGLDVVRPAPDVFAESGRGLYIIRSICKKIESGENGEIKVFITF